VKLGVGGYMEQVIGITFDRDDAADTGGGGAPGLASGATSVKQYNESEIHFKGSGKLDNGIEIVADVQLEVAGSPGQVIDEHYAIVRGNFGQVLIGVEDIAPYLMTTGYIGSFATGVGLSLVYDRPNWIRAPSSGAFSKVNGNTTTELQGPANDPNQISYFSPRFSGFQVGVSYIPTGAQQSNPTNSLADAGTGHSTTGSTGNTTGTIGEKDVFNEGWGIGANYTGKFDNVAVGVAGGYLTMNPPGGTAFAQDDFRGWNIASSVEVGPFKVAGAYRKTVDWDVAATTSFAGTAYDLGARYTFGPNAVSIGYLHGAAEGSTTTTGDDKETGMTLAYARTLAPGVKLTGNLHYTELKEETVAVDNKTENWAFVTTLRLDF
jgi:hypothetical protein